MCQETVGFATLSSPSPDDSLWGEKPGSRQRGVITFFSYQDQDSKLRASSGAGELFLQIGQFLRIQLSIDLLNAHGAQGHADDYGQSALFPAQDGRTAIDLGQRQGQRPLS